MSSAQQKTLEDFIQLQNRNAMSHAIRAAIELGVIEELKKGQRTIEQLATELKVYPDALQRLMNVVVQSELIEKYEEDYALSQIARLIPDRFYDFGDSHWEQLAFHIKTGAPLSICEEIPATDLDYEVNKSSEEWTLTPTALTAATVLDLGKTRRALKMLEVGCGSAVFGATLAHLDPDGVINLFDNEFGLTRAKQTVESIGLEKKTTYIEGPSVLELDKVDALEPESYDLVLAAGLIHRLTSEECRILFSQIHSLVKPGRELAIIDIFAGQEGGELNHSIFELELGLRSSRGRLHNPLETEKQLKEAGFNKVQFAHLPTAPNYWGMILAEK